MEDKVLEKIIAKTVEYKEKIKSLLEIIQTFKTEDKGRDKYVKEYFSTDISLGTLEWVIYLFAERDKNEEKTIILPKGL